MQDKIRSEVFLAAQRLVTFCRQLEKMTNAERKVCIERADHLAPGLLPELYNALNEYME